MIKEIKGKRITEEEIRKFKKRELQTDFRLQPEFVMTEKHYTKKCTGEEVVRRELEGVMLRVYHKDTGDEVASVYLTLPEAMPLAWQVANCVMDCYTAEVEDIKDTEKRENAEGVNSDYLDAVAVFLAHIVGRSDRFKEAVGINRNVRGMYIEVPQGRPT